jgi:hypothetical protein
LSRFNQSVGEEFDFIVLRVNVTFEEAYPTSERSPPGREPPRVKRDGSKIWSGTTMTISAMIAPIISRNMSRNWTLGVKV